LLSIGHFFTAASALADPPPAAVALAPLPPGAVLSVVFADAPLDDFLPFEEVLLFASPLVCAVDAVPLCLRAFSRATQLSTSAAGTSEHARTESP